MFFKLKKIMSYMLVGSFAIGGMYGIGSNNTYGSAPIGDDSTGVVGPVDNGGRLTDHKDWTEEVISCVGASVKFAYKEDNGNFVAKVVSMLNTDGDKYKIAKEVEIPSEIKINADISAEVNEIDSNAFSNWEQLKTIKLPSTLEKISDNAFASLESLENVTFGNEAKVNLTIGTNAFYGCTGLKIITLPSNIAKIEESAFGDCTGLKTVTFDKGNSKTTNLTAVCKYAFQNCSSLTEINLEVNGELERIGREAFKGCARLHRITIPEKVKIYGQHIFVGCENTANDPMQVIFKNHKSIMPEIQTKEQKEADGTGSYDLVKDISELFGDDDGGYIYVSIYFDDYALYRPYGLAGNGIMNMVTNGTLFNPEPVGDYEKFKTAYEAVSKIQTIKFIDVRCLDVITEHQRWGAHSWITGGIYESVYNEWPTGSANETQYMVGNFRRATGDTYNYNINMFKKMFPVISEYNIVDNVEYQKGHWEINAGKDTVLYFDTTSNTARTTGNINWTIGDFFINTNRENIEKFLDDTSGIKTPITCTFKNGTAPANNLPGPDSAMPGDSSTDFVSVSTESSSGSEFVDYHHEITADKPVDLSTIKSDADHVVIKKGDVYYTVEKQDFSGEAYNPTTSISTVDEKTLSAQTSEVQSLIKGVESKKSISNSKSVVLDVKDIHAKSSITFNLGEEYKGKIVAVSYIDQSKKESIGYAEFIVKDGSVTIKDIGKPCTFIFTIIK